VGTVRKSCHVQTTWTSLVPSLQLRRKTKVRIGNLSLLVGLLIVPVIVRADDVSATISACGQPSNAFTTTDGKYDVQYKQRSVWLKYQFINGQWRWYKAFSDRTSQDFSRTQLVKRMPCVKAMLEANAKDAASVVAPTVVSSTSSSSENGGSSSWLLVAIALLATVLLALSRKDRLSKLRAMKDCPVKCPSCGSEQVHAEKRGWRVTTGFIGSSKVLITCLRCGRKFKPWVGYLKELSL